MSKGSICCLYERARYTLSLTRPRSVGVEQVGLWALERLGLVELLAGLGVNAALRTAAVGSIVARLAYPSSERATHEAKIVGVLEKTETLSVQERSSPSTFRAGGRSRRGDWGRGSLVSGARAGLVFGADC